METEVFCIFLNLKKVKMETKELVSTWFKLWEQGDFENLPLANGFEHSSPFGTISGKEQYLDLVRANRDKFLGHKFEILDALYSENKACVRYITRQEGNHEMEVSEWIYTEDNCIQTIHSYYHIGEIREERKLNS